MKDKQLKLKIKNYLEDVTNEIYFGDVRIKSIGVDFDQFIVRFYHDNDKCIIATINIPINDIIIHKDTTVHSDNMLQRIIDSNPDTELVRLTGFDGAVIGVNEDLTCLIYSIAKILEILERDMSAEEALEHLSFNITGAYVGEQTPIWCYDNF
jgi:hypothetical protein